MAAGEILLVEDDAQVVTLVRGALTREGFSVQAATNGDYALKLARERNFDLIILDIVLGDEFIKAGERLDGVTLLRRFRAQSDVLILMLTSTSVGEMKVLTLEMGADDYLTKPFDVRELTARVKALMRRRDMRGRTGQSFTFGALRVDAPARKVWKGNQEVELTPNEFDILLTLCQRPGRVFTRDMLLNHALRTGHTADERVIDTHIANLRRKIEDDPKQPSLIVTVRGAGYRLEPPDTG